MIAAAINLSCEFETPPETFAVFNNLYGPFEIDVAADSNNTKCAYFFDPVQNGLTQDWAEWERVWLCPPRDEIAAWIEKASKEAEKGCSIGALLPARTDTKWFHEFIYNRPNVEVLFIKGRLKSRNAGAHAPYPSMFVYFRGKKI